MSLRDKCILYGRKAPALTASFLAGFTLAVHSQTNSIHAAERESSKPSTLEVQAESLAAAVETQAEALATERSQKAADHKAFKELLGLGISYLAITLGIGIGFFAIWCDYRKHRELLTAYHQERMSALEKGIELPPYPQGLLQERGDSNNFLRSILHSSDPNRGLKSGLMWLVIGIGLTIYLSADARTSLHPSIGVLPIGIGLVYLVCYFVERRKTNPRPGQQL